MRFRVAPNRRRPDAQGEWRRRRRCAGRSRFRSRSTHTANPETGSSPAFSMPEISFPAMGCAPRKRAPRVKCLAPLAANHHFGASRVGDQRFRFGDARQLPAATSRIVRQSAAPRKPDPHHARRWSHRSQSPALRHAPRRACGHLRPIESDEGDIGKMFSQGEGERTADQASADDSYAREGNWDFWGRHASSLMQIARNSSGSAAERPARVAPGSSRLRRFPLRRRPRACPAAEPACVRRVRPARSSARPGTAVRRSVG